MVGFALFAGFLMILGGIFQLIEGIAALFNGSFFAVWGWTHLIIGIIIVIAGVAIFSGRVWGRIVGIIFALLSAITNFFYIPFYPIWSIIIITLDVIIIWALASYTPEKARSK